MDTRLSSSQTAAAAEEDDKSIFTSKREPKASSKPNLYAEEIERKKLAENERLKGNEFMAAKEYQEAVKCYSKSIELFPEDAATYANRA